MNKDDGGPAFPAIGLPRHSDYDNTSGMALRDWFAGQALAGLMANTVAWTSPGADEHYAAACWKVADAMLKVRARC